MALMIPDDIERFNTDGEERFYRFLQAAAKPGSKHVAWYLPDIEGKEPDFILFSDEVGLDSLEPNGWSPQQVRNLAYVAITRARHQLCIPYVKENELVSDLLSCL